MPFLNAHALSIRWDLTPATLAQWRWNGRGPKYIKMGKHILYPIQEIEAFEAKKIRSNTSQKFPL